MSFATNSIDDALRQLTAAVKSRYQGESLPAQVEVLRTPVALVFLRGDRAEPGASLAKQVVASFGYWNVESAKYFDLVFFGWWKEGEQVGFQGHESARISEGVAPRSSAYANGDTVVKPTFSWWISSYVSRRVVNLKQEHSHSGNVSIFR